MCLCRVGLHETEAEGEEVMIHLIAALLAIAITNMAGTFFTAATGFGVSWPDRSFLAFVVGLDFSIGTIAYFIS